MSNAEGKLASSSADASDWVAEFFKTADSGDADAIAEWFAPRIDMRFANNPAASTKEQAREGLRHFLSTIASSTHHSVERIGEGDAIVQLAQVTYVKPDGQEMTLPVASHLRRDANKLIDRLWIYIDLAPLFAG